MQKEFEACRNIIEKHQRFILTTHINPDADGIGSELALSNFLKSKGKETFIFNHSATPPNCGFLDPQRQIIQFDSSKHADYILNADVIFVLDANHPDRLQSLKPYLLQSKAKKVCIDHHLDKADFADLYIIDEPSAATGEILYHLLFFLDKNAINKEIATSLYTAIMTDTGSFRFPKTDPELHEITADLIARGADPVETYQQIYEQGTANRLQLLGKVLAELKLAHNNKVAFVVVTQQMFSETHTSEADTDNFITYTLTIQGIQIGLMFTETAEGIKVSFRSKGDIPINELAREFGGNGHKNAAGARIEQTSLSEVLPSVLERSQRYII